LLQQLAPKPEPPERYAQALGEAVRGIIPADLAAKGLANTDVEALVAAARELARGELRELGEYALHGLDLPFGDIYVDAAYLARPLDFEALRRDVSEILGREVPAEELQNALRQIGADRLPEYAIDPLSLAAPPSIGGIFDRTVGETLGEIAAARAAYALSRLEEMRGEAPPEAPQWEPRPWLWDWAEQASATMEWASKYGVSPRYAEYLIGQRREDWEPLLREAQLMTWSEGEEPPPWRNAVSLEDAVEALRRDVSEILGREASREELMRALARIGDDDARALADVDRYTAEDVTTLDALRELAKEEARVGEQTPKPSEEPPKLEDLIESARKAEAERKLDERVVEELA
ncbi:MAG: hypothetical protein ACP5MH_12300, partial [Thermoproteus sp.]